MYENIIFFLFFTVGILIETFAEEYNNVNSDKSNQEVEDSSLKIFKGNTSEPAKEKASIQKKKKTIMLEEMNEKIDQMFEMLNEKNRNNNQNQKNNNQQNSDVKGKKIKEEIKKYNQSQVDDISKKKRVSFAIVAIGAGIGNNNTLVFEHGLTMDIVCGSYNPYRSITPTIGLGIGVLYTGELAQKANKNATRYERSGEKRYSYKLTANGFYAKLSVRLGLSMLNSSKGEYAGISDVRPFVGVGILLPLHDQMYHVLETTPKKTLSRHLVVDAGIMFNVLGLATFTTGYQFIKNMETRYIFKDVHMFHIDIGVPFDIG